MFRAFLELDSTNVFIVNDVKLIVMKDTLLTDRQKEVIRLRKQGMTQQQIAKVMGISQVQVSRIEKKVLLRMREKMKKVE